jgi:hypothetical protein
MNSNVINTAHRDPTRSRSRSPVKSEKHVLQPKKGNKHNKKSKKHVEDDSPTTIVQESPVESLAVVLESPGVPAVVQESPVEPVDAQEEPVVQKAVKQTKHEKGIISLPNHPFIPSVTKEYPTIQNAAKTLKMLPGNQYLDFMLEKIFAFTQSTIVEGIVMSVDAVKQQAKPLLTRLPMGPTVVGKVDLVDVKQWFTEAGSMVDSLRTELAHSSL